MTFPSLASALAVRGTGRDEATGEEAEREIPFLKGYTVFNVEQVEGLPADFYAVAEPRLDPVQRIERADAFFGAIRADIRHGGDMAYYSAADDHVQMPPFVSFRDAESAKIARLSFLSTLSHEAIYDAWSSCGSGVRSRSADRNAAPSSATSSSIA